MIQLRPYQLRAIDQLYSAIRAGHRRILWVMPTGAGKSTVTSRFVKACVKNQKHVLFFVHSKELVQQFASRLINQFNIPSGIIMAGTEPNRARLTQVASVQTLVRRKLPPADVVIIDETHRARAKTYARIIKNYPDAILIGLTATPFRGDGKGLKDVFDVIVNPVRVYDLIEKGFLVGTKVFGPAEAVDMKGVRTVAGDYDKKEMFKRFSDGAVTRGVIDNYLNHANGKKSIVFNINVEHSKEMNRLFQEAGINSEHLDGTTPRNERDRIVKRFRSGSVTVLNNVMLFTEGFDVPDAECVILNRATKSKGLYVQMVGRGLRPADEKEHCVVLDHGGNTLRFGFAEDYDAGGFTLEDDKKKNPEDAPTKQCPSCRAIVKMGTRQCGCGFSFPIRQREITFGERGKFIVYDREAIIVDRLIGMRYATAIKDLTLGQMRIFALLRGYKKGWWFHHAIDSGKVNVLKDHPNAWREVKFLLEVAETREGTHSLYKKLKNANVSGQVGEVLRQKSYG